MLAHVAQRIADLLLTVRIKARRIKETDTRVIRLAKQYLRIIKRDTLDWQRAKSIFIDDNIRLSKGNRRTGYPFSSSSISFSASSLSSIQTLKDKMMEMGADGSLMSGSGPTVFGLFTNQTAAQAAYEELRYGSSQDLAKQVYLTSFYNRKGHADGEQF